MSAPLRCSNVSVTESMHVCAKSLQSCSPLCDPMDCSLPGPSVHGILLARILQLAAICFSRYSQPRDHTGVSCIAGRFSYFLK